MDGHADTIGSMSFSYDSRLLSGCFHKNVRVWDTITGELVHDLHGHHDTVWSVSFSASNYRVASASSYMILIWDGEKGERISTLEFDHHFEAKAISVALSNKGDLVACAFLNDTVKLWDVETGSQIHKLQDSFGYPEHLEFSQCGQFLALLDMHGVSMWDIDDSGNPQRMPLDYNPSRYPFKFGSKCELWVLDRNEARYWDPHAKTIDNSDLNSMVVCNTEMFRGFNQPPATSHISSSTGFVDRVWDWLEKHNQVSLLPHSTVFSLTGTLLALNNSGEIQVLDLTTRDTTLAHWGEKRQFPFGFADDPGIRFSPDGNLILFRPNVSREDNAIWNIETGKVEQISSFHFHDVESMVRYLFISPSGKMMAYYQDSGISVANLRLQANGPKLECKIQLDDYSVAHLITFSPDDQWLAWEDSDDVYVFDIEERTKVRISDYLDWDTERAFHPSRLVFSHDSRHLACLLPNDILIWNTKSWEMEKILPIPRSSNYSKVGLAFSDEDSCLVVSEPGRSGDQPTKIITLNWPENHDLQIYEVDAHRVIRSFSLELSQIDTSTGTFQLTQDRICKKGYGLSRDQQWITWGAKHVLWLPLELRPAEWDYGLCYSVCDGNKIAISTGSGPVIYLEFDPAGPGADRYL